MKTPHRLPALCLLGIAAVSTPALAQDVPDEIVVTGEYERIPQDVESLSQTVSYADLDLGTRWGREELRQRVRLTARYLCERLGESNFSSPPARSCRDAAERDAMQRLGTYRELYAPRGTAWVAPPAWVAPYPVSWRHE